MAREFLTKRNGWPIERIKGRPVLNFIRLLIHARWYGEFNYSAGSGVSDCCTALASTEEKTP